MQKPIIVKKMKNGKPKGEEYFIFDSNNKHHNRYPDQAINEAIDNFLLSPNGDLMIEACGDRFTWKEALDCIPPSYWKDEGLIPIKKKPEKAEVLKVDIDEDLIPDWYWR